jgi:tRNA threonylcarbamoyladenosine biosynthesis protein TsaE
MTARAANSVRLGSEAEQEAFGAELASICNERRLTIHLIGNLGAGKTTLTRGFLRGCGYRGAVKSPTYTLIEPYAVSPLPVYHLDLYRVADPGELEYLGLRDILEESAILLIEWPERGVGWLPEADLTLTLEHVPGGREVSWRGHGTVGEAIAVELSAKATANI